MIWSLRVFSRSASTTTDRRWRGLFHRSKVDVEIAGLKGYMEDEGIPEGVLPLGQQGESGITRRQGGNLTLS
jgi:hypothetical protein